jgi:hypothetical protein
MSAPRYGNRRANCTGYLEFIWRETGVKYPQAIAYITDDSGAFYGVYGRRVFAGSTVADVKAQLFPALDADA